MRKQLMTLVLSVMFVLGGANTAQAHEDNHRGHDGDQECGGEGCGGYKPFSLDFNDSPVVIWFCPQQNSCNNNDGSRSGGNEPAPLQ